MKVDVNLKLEEFCQALHKGMGRAYLYIQKYGDSQVRDILLSACLKNMVYDPQCEEERAEWLISLIDLTENQDYYFSQIINGLISSTEFWDTDQLFSLCQIIAERNITTAKQAIYQKFDLQEFYESFLGGYEIINLDGVAGLIYVIQLLGRRLVEVEDYWEDEILLDYAYEKLGKEKINEYLEAEAKKNKYIRAYLENCQNKLENESYLNKSRRKYSLERVISDIENKRYKFPYHYTVFGKKASEQEIEIVFDKLLTEVIKEKIIRYLWVFRNRELPRLDDKIFQLVSSNDRDK